MPLRNQRALPHGFGMLEVLITLVVMSVGMLGIASMLLIAHKASSSSYLRQQAIQSAYNLLDTMRANRQEAINGSYNLNNLAANGAPTLPAAASPDCSSATCSAKQLATYDKWYWLTKDLAKLPNGSASVTTSTLGSNTTIRVIIQWDDSPAQQLLGANGQASTLNANLVQYSIGTSL